MGALQAIVTAAENGMANDQMLDHQNAKGEALIMAGVNSLVDQTRSFEKIVSALSLQNVAFEGSDSLDNPDAIFQ